MTPLFDTRLPGRLYLFIGRSLPCWIKQFDYMDTLLSYTLGPILLMVAIMGMFVIKNSGTLLKKKEATAAEKVQRPKFTKPELKEMYLLPDEVEACFTRFELKGIRKTFGRQFINS
mgnify:CR=1 FL=1